MHRLFWGLVVLDNISLVILNLLLYGHKNKSTILSLIINLQICKKEITAISTISNTTDKCYINNKPFSIYQFEEQVISLDNSKRSLT